MIPFFRFTQKAKQVSKIMLRDQETMAEKINFWTNFVLENKGNTILQSSKKHSWIETLPTDIFLALVLTLILFFIFVRYILKLTYPILKNTIKIKME